jgi:cysteine-rich repeat protein
VFLLVAFVAVGTATPDQVGASATTQLVAEVTPDATSTGVAVRCDLTPIGDVANVVLYDDGVHGDGAAGDLRFGLVAFVEEGTPLGDRSLPCQATDFQGALVTFAIALTVIAACGDSVTQPPEQCDDGGVEDADGCDSDCRIEVGWGCLHTTPSLCYTRCGDGRVVGPEECDDGAHHAGDGCGRLCLEEPGYECTGEPSVCMRVALCGDGLIDGDERCDDGNVQSDDGCDSTCTVETGWDCTDEPSHCCTGDGFCAGIDAGMPDAGTGDDPGDGGCCSTTGKPGGALLLTAVLAWLRRRQISMST